MARLFNFFKIKHNDIKECHTQNDRKEAVCMRAEFIDGIDVEENPFENESPDKIVVYDFNGNEVGE